MNHDGFDGSAALDTTAMVQMILAVSAAVAGWLGLLRTQLHPEMRRQGPLNLGCL